jgi:hypothetical protein
MKFPEAVGSNLLRQKLTLPDDLQGELNILLVAFHQWHQSLIDTWLPLANQLEQSFPGVQVYEIPVIQKMNFFAQTFINEGMRAGIPNPTTRQKTITLYLEKQAFRRALDIPNEETIWVLVLDQQGNVLWQTSGAHSPENGAALLSAVQAHLTKKSVGGPG